MESVRLASATRWTHDRYFSIPVVHRILAMLKQLGRLGMSGQSRELQNKKKLEGSGTLTPTLTLR